MKAKDLITLVEQDQQQLKMPFMKDPKNSPKILNRYGWTSQDKKTFTNLKYPGHEVLLYKIPGGYGYVHTDPEGVRHSGGQYNLEMELQNIAGIGY